MLYYPAFETKTESALPAVQVPWPLVEFLILICCLCRYGKPEGGESSAQRYDAVQNLHGQRHFDAVFAVQPLSLL